MTTRLRIDDMPWVTSFSCNNGEVIVTADPEGTVVEDEYVQQVYSMAARAHVRVAEVIPVTPMISALSPDTMASGGTDNFTVEVVGSGFGEDAMVFFDGSEMETVLIAPDQVNFVLGPHSNAGAYDVTVQSGGLTSNMVPFNFT